MQGYIWAHAFYAVVAPLLRDTFCMDATPLCLGELMLLASHLPLPSASWRVACADPLTGIELATLTRSASELQVQLLRGVRFACAPELDEECHTLLRAFVDGTYAYGRASACRARIVHVETRIDADAHVDVTLRVLLTASRDVPEVADVYDALIAPLTARAVPFAFTLRSLRMQFGFERAELNVTHIAPACVPALFLALQRAVVEYEHLQCDVQRMDMLPCIRTCVQCYSVCFRPCTDALKKRRIGASGFSSADTAALEYRDHAENFLAAPLQLLMEHLKVVCAAA